MRRRLLAMLAVLPLLAAADKAPPLDAGPDPTWEKAVPLAEASIRDSLTDPEYAHFEWPYNFIRGTLKPRIGKTRAGWYTCGRLKTWSGGRRGPVWVLVMINYGYVIEADIGTNDGFDPASTTCPDIIKRGLLPPAPGPAPTAGREPAPAPAPEAASPIDPATAEEIANKGATLAASRGGLGIVYVPTPVGATVMAVAPGSLADKAGLKPGETIAAINGVGLKGFDQAGMMKVFANAANPMVLDIVGVGKVTINR